MSEIKVGIIGATGYTGSELTRILTRHPGVKIDFITSESRAGEHFSDVHPFFREIAETELQSVEQINDRDPGLVFLAVPHGVAMEYVKRFKDRPFRIIDLSGDFRLSSATVYEKWYQKEHSYPEGFGDAVFGIPELFRDQIKDSRLIANPGCYPTCTILGAAPLLAKNLVKPDPVIVDSKSGVTGAGVKAKPVTHFSNVNDNFKAYGLKTHRHTIEIQETLDRISGINTLVQFTPHLLPVDRGILSTIYLQPFGKITDSELRGCYEEFYRHSKFIRLCSKPPAIKDVRGTNYCDIYVTLDERTGIIMVVSVIDNLVKGAAGQAVQNMNIMLGLEENLGLDQVPLNP